MSGSERVAALRRARQRQARIEAATARAIRAHAAVERAIQARAAAAEQHDERVARAEASASADTAELARVCGSADAAAEILGWSTRDVRRVVKGEAEAEAANVDRQQTYEAAPRSIRRSSRPPSTDESGVPDAHD
jgi:hypothetical protein